MRIPTQDVAFSFEDVEFGGYDSELIVNSLTLNEPKYRGENTENPVWHGGWGGRGLLGMGSWEFTMTVNGKDRDDVYRIHRGIYAKWRSFLNQPNPRTRLYYRIGSRYGYVIGHPEDISIPVPDVSTGFGVGRFSMKFVQTDPLFYNVATDGGTAGGSVTLMLDEIRTGSSSALPLEVPFILGVGGAYQTRQGFITNNGEAPTTFSMRIYGPVKSPSVSGPGWKMSWPTLTLLPGHVLTVRPGEQFSRMNSGDIVWPSADSRFNSRLMPGAQEIIVSGVDPTNTCKFEFWWDEASYTI